MARTLVATLAAIGVILLAVFVVLTMDTRSRATAAVYENLDAGDRMFAELERRYQVRAQAQATAVAENVTLGAAVKAVLASLDSDGEPSGPAIMGLQRELDRIAGRLNVDALVVAGPRRDILASAGPRRAAWPPDQPVWPEQPGDLPDLPPVIARPTGVFRVTPAPLASQAAQSATVLIARALDDDYTETTASLLRTQLALVFDDQLVASSLPPSARGPFYRRLRQLPESGTIDLDGEPYAIRRLPAPRGLGAYLVESIGVSDGATRGALTNLVYVAIGAMILGIGASLWLARSVARPIDQLSQQIHQMTERREFTKPLARSGSSLELDTFTDTFNRLVQSVRAAEAQTELAYVGAIKALAAALDARDPYTAGHSERVSALSVMIGRQLQLALDDLDVLRLGALLHDIGKIGVADRVLQKSGPLTAEEFEIIKTHPGLGAHILRKVPFLAPHIPIVELHHERPDGRGYPHRLLGNATPLLARIVHVADAFDAMTTARAYRPAQTTAHALSELWRCAGSQFDSEVVEAFVAAWSAVPVADVRSDVKAILARVDLSLVDTDLPTGTDD